MPQILPKIESVRTYMHQSDTAQFISLETCMQLNSAQVANINGRQLVQLWLTVKLDGKRFNGIYSMCSCFTKGFIWAKPYNNDWNRQGCEKYLYTHNIFFRDTIFILKNTVTFFANSLHACGCASFCVMPQPLTGRSKAYIASVSTKNAAAQQNGKN